MANLVFRTKFGFETFGIGAVEIRLSNFLLGLWLACQLGRTSQHGSDGEGRKAIQTSNTDLLSAIGIRLKRPLKGWVWNQLSGVAVGTKVWLIHQFGSDPGTITITPFLIMGCKPEPVGWAVNRWVTRKSVFQNLEVGGSQEWGDRF